MYSDSTKIVRRCRLFVNENEHKCNWSTKNCVHDNMFDLCLNPVVLLSTKECHDLCQSGSKEYIRIAIE